LQSIENGSVKLEISKGEDLPSDLQKLSAAGESRRLKASGCQARIAAQIVALSKQREDTLPLKEKTDRQQNKVVFGVAVALALRNTALKGISSAGPF